MKKHILYLMLAACTAFFYSCSSGGGKTFENKDGISKIAGDLNDEFGKDAHYTSVVMSYHKDIGTMVSATGTKDPASKKLISKLKVKGSWEDRSEVTLEIEGNVDPAAFMFKLNDVDNLTKVPDMIKLSVDKIKKEKNFDVVIESVNISAPQRINGPDDKVRFMLNLAPPNGGTTFIAVFDDKGQFQRLVY